jgi:hypothetical protein
MSIQTLLPDREICQEAQKKGVVIESSFYYWMNRWGGWADSDEPVLENHIPNNPKDGWKFYPAPLTDEIFPKLPAKIKKDNLEFLLIITNENDIYSCFYSGKSLCIYVTEDKKLSNAMLLLSIKLKEENLLK